MLGAIRSSALLFAFDLSQVADSRTETVPMERSRKKRLCLRPTNITYEARRTYANATDDGVKMGRASTTKLEQFLDFGKFNEE